MARSAWAPFHLPSAASVLL
uniref:Uncharacterized protein n=1 Tax=Arundo donax TaxID=35708 RepID=A0A0A9HGK4_ARUDO